MKTCKTCASEFEGNFCNACGQRYIEKQTFQFAWHQLLDVIDLRKGLFKTSYYLLLKPHRLIEDYLNGRTKTYIHPIGYLLITAGIFYAIDELGILGFTGIGMYGNQLQILFGTIFIILISSFVVGRFKFVRYNSIELLIINLFLGACFLILTFVLDILNHFDSIYEWGTGGEILFRLIWIIFLVWFLRYQWMVFRPKVLGAIVNFIVLISSTFLIGKLSEIKFQEEDEIGRYNFPASKYWVIQRKDKIKDIAYADSIVLNPLWADLTHDDLDECLVLLYDSIANPIVALFKIDEETPQIIHLQDYGLSKKISDWKANGNKALIDFVDSTKAEIYWDQTSFRVKSSLTK